MDVCKCMVPLQYKGTLNSRRAASPLVWLVEEQWSKDGTASRRLDSARPRGTTERDRRIQCIAVKHCIASTAEIGATVTQQTVRNRLLQGQFQARRLIACIPLPP
ncbi:uncharacterized protein TNCV_2206061 [Trichonephila clavipes]|nr:uncharacterized protein TNCV_2206061 [Trichonephila clavipes]